MRARVVGGNRPLLLGWALTNRCDLHCSYCDRPEHAGKQLDTEAALALADDIARSGVLLVTLTGGEPLLRRDAGKIVDRLRDGGVLVGVNTDGTFLPRRIDEIARANLVTVSVDGPEEVHDRVRGAGSFRTAVAGIRAARARGMRVASHAVLTSANVRSFDFFLEFASEHGVAVGFSPVDSFPLSSPGVHDVLPRVDELRAFLDRAIAAKEGGDHRISDSVPCLRYLLNWPEYQPLACSAGRMFCRVEPDGSLYTCGALVGIETPADATQGLLRGLDQLDSAGCRSCWCDSEVEMNLLHQGDLAAIANAARTLLGVLRA
jgi:MoaA/NifB/PqqE/SkfB family radical SAM enzyme